MNPFLLRMSDINQETGKNIDINTSSNCDISM